MSGHEGLEETMQTSLRGIAEKAALHKTYRFRNLFGMLNVGFLLWCWNFLNKKSASGVDRVSASQYSADLEGNITKKGSGLYVIF